MQPQQSQSGRAPTAPPGALTVRSAARHHLGRWIGIIGVVLMLGVVTVLLFLWPGFLVTTVLNPQAVAATIESQSRAGGGSYMQVTCPSNERVAAGTTFVCTASGGRQIQVTINNNRGDYTWAPVR